MAAPRTPSPPPPPLRSAPRRGRRFGLALLISLILAPGLALAQFAEPKLDDPALEARAVEMHKSIRCLVCQNQSVADSNAALARDIRAIIRERIAAGDGDAEVRDYLVARYGDWVLMKPPLNASTVLLWAGPFVVFAGVAAGAVVFVLRRRRKSDPAAPPLSEDERARLAVLMQERS